MSSVYPDTDVVELEPASRGMVAVEAIQIESSFAPKLAKGAPD